MKLVITPDCQSGDSRVQIPSGLPFRRNKLGILEILLIIFIVLKVIGVITWPWMVVLWPLWADLALIALILFIKASM